MPCNPGPGNCPPTDLIAIAPIEVVRYEIALDPDAMPSLWRSARAGIDPGTGLYVPAPGAGAGWQLVARGIEDLQVMYQDVAGNPPAPTPPIVVDANFGTLVREVQVTLRARSDRRLQAGTGTDDTYHGSVQTVVTPRAVLAHLNGQAVPTWR
jgi:hypothetical protein